MPKLTLSSFSPVLLRLPVLLVAGVAVVVLAENGCSGSSSNGGTPGSGIDASNGLACRPGEIETLVGKETLCCAAATPESTCYSEGPRLGDACSASDTANSASVVTVTMDVCVTDSCNGDRSPSTYAAQTISTTQPMTCSGGTFQATGDATVHEVDRVCSDVAPLLCNTTTYGYYGYHSSYGYAYYGGQELMKRTIAVQSSTCAVGSAAPSACDVGSL